MCVLISMAGKSGLSVDRFWCKISLLRLSSFRGKEFVATRRLGKSKQRKPKRPGKQAKHKTDKQGEEVPNE